MSSRRSISLLLLVPCAALLIMSCNVQHCESLRDDLSAEKQKWQTCQADSDCTIVGGNTKDCTGILYCNTAVNRVHREEAERRIASLPEETVDCVECKGPNCISGTIPLCDQVTKTCFIVSEIINPSPDSTSPPSDSTDTPDAGAGSDAGYGSDAGSL
jgi:hypothetical protein